jgi:hypothetical protein
VLEAILTEVRKRRGPHSPGPSPLRERGEKHSAGFL